ncbi:hypothetical protein ABZ468_53300 [Streptomyces sp. NPDC005708]|uniref:phage tail tube protein n=1 Tax=Streptomyces sp. NPDC005708 TaxID=3154564 RepID=UPI0033C4749C
MPATAIAPAVRSPARLDEGELGADAGEQGGPPSHAELNAGTELSVEVGAVDGWQIVSATVDAPTLGSKLTAKTDGANPADDSSLTLYALQTGTDVPAGGPQCPFALRVARRGLPDR